jgi:hypothetical protein
MKNIFICLTLIIWILSVSSIYSQVTFSGNTFPGGTPYVGWDGSSSVTLDKKK